MSPTETPLRDSTKRSATTTLNHPPSGRALINGLFALAILLVPLSSRTTYFGGLFGELSGEGAFYPLAASLAVWGIALLYGDRVYLSDHLSARLLGVFILWITISAAVNLPAIAVAETKGRTGANKLLLQGLVLIFAGLVALLVYRITLWQADPWRSFRRWVLVSFLIAGAFSVLEIASFLRVPAATAMLARVSAVIHPGDEAYFGRVRSMSGEASWFAMYCSLIFPWLLSYLFTQRKRITIHVLLLVYLVTLVTLSWSRTAYIITAAQLALFVGVVMWVRGKRSNKRRALAFMLGAGAALLVATFILRRTRSESFSPAEVISSLLSRGNESNITRIGSQVAAYRIAIDHPVLGVGIGQYGFYMPAYIPPWATASGEIRRWMSFREGTPWPPVHSIYARLAAEAGFIGLGLWLTVWGSLLTGCWRKFRQSSRASGRQDIFGLALFVSMVGVMLSGLNSDSFRFFGYWIIMGLAWRYLGERPGDSLAVPIPPRVPEEGPWLATGASHTAGSLSPISPL
jgi:O-antigen ligase